MKISYNWLKEFIHTDKTPTEISHILTGTGLEVESLEKVQAIPGGLEGLFIGYVKDCAQHPNADRLRVTHVDVGTGQDLQIVCGAPNVAAGQKVVVAVVGTTVYPTQGEPFKINKSKIRGEVSEGMICADDEIGLGTSHEGIMVLPDDAVAGTLAKDYFSLNDDYVYEIGLTPNRADAASHLGTARDVAAFLKLPIQKPDVSTFAVDNESRIIPVQVESKACIRYSSLTILGITVKESPQWLKDRLAVIGIRAINNVVDATNYVLHELGQPLHAFDADKITGNQVIVKTCAENTPFITLDSVERKLHADDLMICNAQEPMCIAGVFGGVSSGVTNDTKNIFLESAYFNPVSVRKTAKRFGLKTDASFRFERGTDPDMTVFALKRAALLIKEIAGGQISSISDIYPAQVEQFKVDFNYKNAIRLIGQDIPATEIRSIIEALDIKVEQELADGLSLSVPPYRVDVTREVDVVEEVLRIYGYNNIHIPTQIRASLNTMSKPDKDTVQRSISDLLTANGFNEMLANSLTSSDYATDAGHAVKILNPLSNDLDIMRQSLLYSGLQAIAYNQNRRNTDLKFYEFGKVYNLREDKYTEDRQLSLFISGAQQGEQWGQKQGKVSFYNLKGIVDELTDRLKLTGVSVEDVTAKDFAYGLQYNYRGGKTLVQFGSVNTAALQKTDVKNEVFYAVFNFDLILSALQKNKIKFQDIPKFPSVRRDLSMLVDTAVSFNDLKNIALKTERKLLKGVNVFDVYVGNKLPADKKSYALSFIIQDDDKTLTDKAIDAVMQKLIYNFGKEAGAEIRK